MIIVNAKKEKLENLLMEYVESVVKSATTSGAEIAALPEVARVLADLLCQSE